MRCCVDWRLARALLICALACVLCSCAGRGRRSEADAAEGYEALPAEEDEYVEPPGTETEPAPSPGRVPRAPLRVALDGNEMEPVRNAPHWVVRQPVSINPVLRYEADAAQVSRTFVFISASNSQGEVTGDTPITIIDPSRETLVPGNDIDLRAPDQCVISAARTLSEVPFQPGSFYLLSLEVHGDGGRKEVSVLFRTEGDGGAPRTDIFRELAR